MSSILKALKKLEQDSALPSTLVLPENTGKSSRSGRRKGLLPLVAVLGVCLFAAGSVSVFYFYAAQDNAPVSSQSQPAQSQLPQPQLPQPQPARPQKTYTPKPQIPGPQIPEPRMRGMTAADAINSGVRQAREPLERLAHTISSDAPHSPAADMPEADVTPDPAPDRTLPPGSLPAGDISALSDTLKSDIPAPVRRSAGSQAPEGAQMPEDPATDDPDKARSVNEASGDAISLAEYDLIEDPGIDLQAISWAVDSSRRMAIINGKICREKEQVSGYRIEAIGSEAVILSKGAKTGKLLFNIR